MKLTHYFPLAHWLWYHRWSHDFHFARDGEGRLLQQCVACGFSRLVLGEQIVRGPAHVSKRDKGAVTTKARTAVPSIQEQRRKRA